MKRSLAIAFVIFGWATATLAAAPVALTSLRAISALSNAEARQALPVAFEATVTFYRGYEAVLFVQDEGLGIFVEALVPANLAPGDRVLVKGKTQDSFRPIVIGSEVTLLRHGVLPKPIPATFDELIKAGRDSLLVTVHGIVQSADWAVSSLSSKRSTVLQVLTDGGYMEADVEDYNPDALKSLLDSEVEITGVAGGRFDDKMQQTGIQIHVPAIAQVKILKRSVSSPWTLSVTPMRNILQGYHVQDSTPRVRVQGIVTYYKPGSALVLQNEAQSLWIMTATRVPLRIGDLVDATGFPLVNDGFLALSRGEVQDSNKQASIAPQPVTWRQLAHGGNSPDGHHYDLVSIEGQVVMGLREGAQDEYVLVADGHLFSAIYPHPDSSSQLPLLPMKIVPAGSRARITGICMPSSPDPLSGPVEFNMMLRSFDDIAIVARPTPLNVRNLIFLVAFLVAVVVAVGARGWVIERKVRKQTAALASLEQRRGRILEDINGSRPLAEIIEQITELVSFKLRGAPCWCQIADGSQLGNCPPTLGALRIVQNQIPARSGPPLGTIYACFDPLLKPSADEVETLSMVAGLVSLALETRRLYSDLRHRSEFDLLTDIHNRFSLDKHLEASIQEGRQNASIFGLIYIDLNKFKQVNDVFGHHVGDLYLQEVALRMKGQLRAGDLLARLGGDEFAVLVPVVHDRADVVEIATRIERCFDDPFAIEGCTICGSASVGMALYPEDGTTKDTLVNAADAAMYAEKYSNTASRPLTILSPVIN